MKLSHDCMSTQILSFTVDKNYPMHIWTPHSPGKNWLETGHFPWWIHPPNMHLHAVVSVTDHEDGILIKTREPDYRTFQNLSISSIFFIEMLESKNNRQFCSIIWSYHRLQSKAWGVVARTGFFTARPRLTLKIADTNQIELTQTNLNSFGITMVNRLHFAQPVFFFHIL